MSSGYSHSLEDFGTRSLVTHGIMALSLTGAIVTGLFVDGQIGLVSFVALLNFTAGMWIAQSIHSAGNARSGGSYDGVLSVLRDTTGEKEIAGLDTGRLARLFTLIAAVTAVSLLTAGQVLSGTLVSIGIVAIGSVALVTAMTGFLIALGSSYDAAERKRQLAVEARTEATASLEESTTDRSSAATEAGFDETSTVEIPVREPSVDERYRRQ
ncbi:hypothetical protein SAMN05444422_110133 [Halobiforma haloterrestris]|uniref:Uncharacterized protein n=1 Tax=Natronobacterium haloterrestre TaxID=148448 RepID=A0A1I1KCG7_NATHA|nr:hypothetical protein [Halobiforma haloterrestris]SFC56398.1 hypothetical protein SAMN05444422_110133 [Halobiforma haloterrestris]